MKQDYTHITIVLDKSPSMDCIKLSTIESFNNFLISQENIEGECTLTLIEFNEKVFIQKTKDIKDVDKLNIQTYVPGGYRTALRDAIGDGIKSTGEFLSSKNENDRPSKVIFMILTDGFENCSTKFSMKDINDLISEHTHIWNWEFVYLGANQDAIAEAGNYGIKASNAMTYKQDSEHTATLFNTMSKNVANYRAGNVQTMSFSVEDRLAQE